ncbi:MAG: exodeoxyribonuclease VII large subunit [Candidatus Aminicenantes bacterium]|nr:exodeoxyribonuclease VII large subunit [Candidatus Aminicenantes bacterium]
MKNNRFSENKKIYSVSEVTHIIKNELEQKFPLIWVEGEVSNFKRAHSQHLYFDLKDESCQIRAVMWRSHALKVPFKMEDGIQIVCKGAVSVYAQRGQYQLQVKEVEPKGKGALQLAFEQLKKKLEKEGLFKPEHKKKIPTLPKKVAVVTSPRGAAVIDILQTIERRFAKLHVMIYPVRVQGEGASEEIASALDELGTVSDLDVVIVGRGGGSIEDLWAFNEEKVARAIFQCPVPVISAVGHEVDFTIADFVADQRASTPSAAAEILIEKEQAFLERIESFERRMEHQLKYMTQERKSRVMELIRHHAFQRFKERLYQLSQIVDDLEIRSVDFIRAEQKKMAEYRSHVRLIEEKISSFIKEKMNRFQNRWEMMSSQLNSLSPLNILKKGYTLCWKDGDDSLVQTIDQVKKGKNMTVSFYKGEFRCEVNSIDKEKLIEDRYKK